MGRNELEEEITMVDAPVVQCACTPGTRFELNAVGPAGRAQSMPLTYGMQLVIGRAPTAHMRLEDPSVSRHHAKVTFGPAGVVLADLGSRNGTRVQGRSIEAPCTVQPGDVIQIGKFVLALAHASSGLRPKVSEPHVLDGTDLLARAQAQFFESPTGPRFVTIQVLKLRSSEVKLERLAAKVGAQARAIDLVAVADQAEVILLAFDVSQFEAERMAWRVLQATRPDAPEASLGFITRLLDADGIQGAVDAARRLALDAVPGEIAGRGAETAIGCLLAADGHPLVLCDPRSRSTFRHLFRLAKSGSAVLIVGESGTGKEEAARKFHEWSARPGPFVAVSCAEIHEPLLAPEIFGHAKFAYTDAKEPRQGLAQSADGGTLFLDELGELSNRGQGTLLRFVETREARPVGSRQWAPQRLDIAIIAATTRRLHELRQELRHRFAVVELPPLRSRRDDIGPMARNFLNAACKRQARPTLRLTPSIEQRLSAYSWPGNVRELIAAMEKIAREVERDVLEDADFSFLGAQTVLPAEELVNVVAERATSLGIAHIGDPSSDGPGIASTQPANTRRDTELEEAARAMHTTNGNKTRAAAMLGITRNTLKRRLGAYMLRLSKGRS